MAKEARTPKKTSTRTWSPAQVAVQNAGRITGDLVNNLQKVRKAYLTVGQLLTEVRDNKHYVTLHHETMEDYAEKRLQLSARSMYRFMKLYAWVREKHKAWLEPDAKIPDLFKIEGLIWVEQELANKKLDESRKEELEAVQEKALKGKLSKKELRNFQRRGSKTDKAVRSLIAATRALRGRYARSKSEAARKSLPLFDQILGLMGNDLMLETAGLGILDDWRPKSDRQGFPRRNSMIA